MCNSLRRVGKIVSRKLLTGKSVCIACGQPTSSTHMGFQTAQSLKASLCEEKVRKGLLSPGWRRYSLLSVKDLIKSGEFTCPEAVKLWLGW